MTQTTYISHSSGGWESKIKKLADLVPGESLLFSLQKATFSLLSSREEEGKERGGRKGRWRGEGGKEREQCRANSGSSSFF